MKILVLLTFLLFISCKEKENTFFLYSKKVNSLSDDSLVQVNGFNIGKIRSIQLVNDSTFIEISVRKDFDIPVDSKFSETPNLLSNSNIDINLGKKQLFFKNNDTINLYYEKKLYLKKIDTIEGIVKKALSDIINVLEKDSINANQK